MRVGFDEFDEDAARGFGVYESDFVAAGSSAWRFVDEGDAQRLEEGERALDAFDFDGDVVQARSALVEKLFETFVSLGRDELETRLANRKQRGVGLLRQHNLSERRRDTENLHVFFGGFVDVPYTNRDVIDLFDSEHAPHLLADVLLGNDCGAACAPRTLHFMSERLFSKLMLGGVLLAAAEGCGGGSLAQPFEGLKAAPITVYRLQNYEPPPQQAPAAGAGLPFQLPPQIQQYWTAAQSLVPPGWLPPGIGGAAAPPAADANVARFHDFRILGWVPLQDKKQHDELLDIFGNSSNFNTPKETCMYADFGVSIAQAQGQPPVDILVSPPCGQVKSFGFAWPYGNNNGLSSDSDKRILDVMKKAFGGG